MNEHDFKETLRKYYGGWRKRLDECLVSVETMSKHFESPELADDVSAALTEVDRLKNLSVTELATENQSVTDYCKHWEERVEKAETEAEDLLKVLGWSKDWRDIQPNWKERAEKAEIECDRLRKLLESM